PRQHVAGELFKAMSKTDTRHVAYRGTAAQDLLGGHISMTFGNISTLLPLVTDGQIRALAVTSLNRVPAASNIPTMHELGYSGFDVTAWFGLMAPAGTPS